MLVDRDQKKTVFQVSTTYTSHQLVEVSLDKPIAIEYDKPQSGLNFKVLPVDDLSWQLIGKIDPDIVQLLQLPVERLRQAGIAPLLSTENVQYIQSLGRFEQINVDQYDADLLLPFSSILDYLYGVWRPRVPVRPPIILRDVARGVRILPQKIIRSQHGRTRLKVVFKS